MKPRNLIGYILLIFTLITGAAWLGSVFHYAPITDHAGFISPLNPGLAFTSGLLATNLWLMNKNSAGFITKTIYNIATFAALVAILAAIATTVSKAHLVQTFTHNLPPVQLLAVSSLLLLIAAIFRAKASNASDSGSYVSIEPAHSSSGTSQPYSGTSYQPTTTTPPW